MSRSRVTRRARLGCIQLVCPGHQRPAVSELMPFYQGRAKGALTSAPSTLVCDTVFLKIHFSFIVGLMGGWPSRVKSLGKVRATDRLQCVDACLVRLRVTRGCAAAGRHVQMPRDQREHARGGACGGGRRRVTPRGRVDQGLAPIMCVTVF